MSFSIDSLQHQRQQLLDQIAALPQFRRGTVIERSHTCGKPTCHCAQEESRKHFQYQWTASIKGKTETKNLHLGPQVAKYLDETNVYRQFQALCEQFIHLNEKIADALPPEDVSTQDELAVLKKKLRKKLHTQRRKKSIIL